MVSAYPPPTPAAHPWQTRAGAQQFASAPPPSRSQHSPARVAFSWPAPPFPQPPGPRVEGQAHADADRCPPLLRSAPDPLPGLVCMPGTTRGASGKQTPRRGGPTRTSEHDTAPLGGSSQSGPWPDPGQGCGCSRHMSLSRLTSQSSEVATEKSPGVPGAHPVRRSQVGIRTRTALYASASLTTTVASQAVPSYPGGRLIAQEQGVVRPRAGASNKQFWKQSELVWTATPIRRPPPGCYGVPAHSHPRWPGIHLLQQTSGTSSQLRPLDSLAATHPGWRAACLHPSGLRPLSQP